MKRKDLEKMTETLFAGWRNNRESGSYGSRLNFLKYKKER
jgi:hypothetical protein